GSLPACFRRHSVTVKLDHRKHDVERYGEGDAQMPRPQARYYLAVLLALFPGACIRGDSNLLADPSFEATKSKYRFGLVFAKWGGWKYEGDCDFRVGEVAHSGKHSCLLYGGIGAKIRVAQNVELSPGRYRVTAYLRGLDIGKGMYNWTTEF